MIGDRRSFGGVDQIRPVNSKKIARNGITKIIGQLCSLSLGVLGWGTDGCSAVGSHGLGIRCMDVSCFLTGSPPGKFSW